MLLAHLLGLPWSEFEFASPEGRQLPSAMTMSFQQRYPTII